MFAIIHLLATFIADLFKPPRRLEVENLFLRHQLNVALRRAPHRVRLRAGDRALMVWMTRMWPSLLGLTRVVQPATILRWHRCGFRAYWRWKSRGRPGRPRVSRELRELIHRMSKENPLWGAPRIHGELLKLGFGVAESTVSKYMIRHRGPPSRAAIANLANVPAQPCRRDRSNRSLRSPHGDIRTPVCTRNHRSRASQAALGRRDPASDDRMVGAADRRGVPMGHRSDLPHPRP